MAYLRDFCYFRKPHHWLYTTQQLAEKGYKPGDKLDFGQFGDSTLELGVASGGITEGIEQALD